MKIKAFVLCALLGAAAASKLTVTENHVLAHIHRVNQMEIDAGKLAQKKGTTHAVKSYGEMLVKDHSQNDRDIMAFAKKHGEPIGKEIAMNDGEKRDMQDGKDAMDRLKNMKGADFDREFLATMAAGHDEELAKIDTAIGQVTDTELARMLKDMKPVLQKHADEARNLQHSNAQASNTP